MPVHDNKQTAMKTVLTISTRTRRSQRGQSLAIAVVVMFVLLFIGGIFVGIVARNLQNSGRDTDTSLAYNLAQAGVDYCNNNLMNSPDGADWRPSPTPLTDTRDPDALWLSTGEWTRINQDRGRTLVRVTYSPGYIDDPTDPSPLGKRQVLSPQSRRLKIESIGRVGRVVGDDPTTFTNQPAPRLRRQLVAFKSLGLPDYLFFGTNLDNDSKYAFNLGVPQVGIRFPAGYSGPQYPLAMQLGNVPTRTFGSPGTPNFHAHGAPMAINGDLNIYGPVNLAINPLMGEIMRVAGAITPIAHEAGQEARVLNMRSGTTGILLPTENPSYSTFDGAVLDGNPNGDAAGYARNNRRLEPPRLDTVDPQSGLTRYILSSRRSGQILNGVDLGAIGMGGGIYVDNFNNTEPETKNVPGGRSLRSIWLDPASPNSRWNGPHYVPNGVYIEPGYPVVQYRNADTSELTAGDFRPTPGFRIVRDPDDQRFRDPAGRFSSTTEVDFTFFIYKPIGQRPVLKLESEFFRSALRTAPFNLSEKQIDKVIPPFNGVIYCEGNVRIKGLMPSRQNIQIRRESSGETPAVSDAEVLQLINSPAVSIVSGANIYVEGSLIRENADSMIGLLAQENVVLNPTMFVAPNKGMSWNSTNGDVTPPYHVSIDTAEPTRTPPFSLEFFFGDDPSQYFDYNGNPMTVNLMVRHGVSQPGTTFLNLFLNDSYSRALNNPLYTFNIPNLPTNIYAMGSDQNNAAEGYFEHRLFQIAPKPTGSTYLFTGDPGYAWPFGLKNTIRPGVDPNFTQGSGVKDYLFARAAVVPMDVRVEALMYAQNGMFFVIPGYAFNNDKSDTIQTALARAASLGLPAGAMTRPTGTDDSVPFYMEPIDCRITILGAIAANKSASIADQAAWNQLWGFIPEVYGSTIAPNEKMVPRAHLFVDEVGLNSGDQRTAAEKSARITRGIRYIYDPALASPYLAYDPGRRAFRSDDAFYDQAAPLARKDTGRVLPPLPRLPVCPGYDYFGEVKN